MLPLMMRVFTVTALLLIAAPALARDIWVIATRDPQASPQEIAQHLESHGMPRGTMAAVSPPGVTNSAWRRLTLDYRGKGPARVNLMKMERPPFLANRTPEVLAILDRAVAFYGFISAAETGPIIRMKALVAGYLAEKGLGMVYDQKFGVPMPVALWKQQTKDENFEFPMGVDRAVLRCYSIPSSPVETAVFRWIPTSIGAVAFDDRSVAQVMPTTHMPAGSIEAGRVTTGGVAYRFFDMEKEWGSGKPSGIATQYVLLNYERGGLALPAPQLHGPIEVNDLHVQLVPPGAAAGSLPSLIVESGETIPAGGPSAFIWLGGGSGNDTATTPLIQIARAALRGPYDRRENAIRAIWRIPGPEAVEALREIARAGGGEHLRTLALKGLSARDDGHDALVEVARGSRGREAAEAVQVIANLKKGDTGRVLLETAASDNSTAESRREALTRLRTRMKAEYVPVLRNLLAHSITDVRLLAADLILRVGPSPEARAVLVEELRGGVPDFDLVVPLVTRHQVTEAVPLLIARYAAVAQPVRHRIANALKLLAPTAIVTEASATLPGGLAPNVPGELPPPAAIPAVPQAPVETLSTTGLVSANPRVKRLAVLLAAPITVSAPASADLAPLQVVQLLAGRGLPVGLGQMHVGPTAKPTEWDTLTVKAQEPGKPALANVTQATVPAASGGPARIAYAITCLATADAQALEATAWLAGLIAEKAHGTVADAQGRLWSAADWRKEVLE